MELIEILKWTGTVSMAISAILISFSVQIAKIPWSFLGFLLAHIIWGGVAWSMDEMALFVLNVGFIPIDIYAMYVRYKYNIGENNATDYST